MGSLSADVRGVVAGYLRARDHCVLIEECGWSRQCLVPCAEYIEGHLWEYTPRIVEWVLENMGGRVDPSANDNRAIKLASQYGHVDVVRLLLADPRVDPSAIGNRAIQDASEGGHVEAVRQLLADPRVGPNAKYGLAVRMAIYHGHLEVVDLLMEHRARASV